MLYVSPKYDVSVMSHSCQWDFYMLCFLHKGGVKVTYLVSQCMERSMQKHILLMCLPFGIFLAGLPASHFLYVQNIEAGLPLFLFNYTTRKLHGTYKAASRGRMCIDPYCWSVDGKEKTSFPAQVLKKLLYNYWMLLFLYLNIKSVLRFLVCLYLWYAAFCTS